jgi:hypothetical protein
MYTTGEIILSQNPYVNAKQVLEFYGGFDCFLDFHSYKPEDRDFSERLSDESF